MMNQDVYVRPRTGTDGMGTAQYGATLGPFKAYVTIGKTKTIPKAQSSVVTGGACYIKASDLASLADGSHVILPGGDERPVLEIHSWVDAETGVLDHWRLTFGV